MGLPLGWKLVDRGHISYPMRNARGNVPAPLLIYKGGKAKRIPPSAIGLGLTMPQYIHAFAPGGTLFFSVMLLERRRKLLTEIRTGIYNLE